MKKLICDICKKELNVTDNYDENGYSKFVNVEIRNSRKYGGELDICNDCVEKIIEYFDFHIA